MNGMTIAVYQLHHDAEGHVFAPPANSQYLLTVSDDGTVNIDFRAQVDDVWQWVATVAPRPA